MGKVQKEDGGKKVFGGFVGLAKAWDASERLRTRLRDVQRLVVAVPEEDAKEQAPQGVVAKTVANLRYNHHSMRPLLQLMAPHKDCVPCLNGLVAELRAVFSKACLNPSLITLQDQAWSLRYLFGVFKQQTYRDKAPNDEVMIQLMTDYGINCEEWPRKGSRESTPSRSPTEEGAEAASGKAQPAAAQPVAPQPAAAEVPPSEVPLPASAGAKVLELLT